MKNIIRIVLLALFVCNIASAQTTRGLIKTENVTPHSLTTLGLPTNSVSTGMDVVGNGTYVYLSSRNIGTDTVITSATFSITTKPSGSTASLTTFGTNWVYFKPDVVGDYTVNLHLVTPGGVHDTTKVITAANYLGVGNFEGITGTQPNCVAACHAGSAKFQEIFNRWKVSGHALIFQQQLETSDHYSTSCMKCHTTGYDHNVVASNNGFDDVAASLGWSFVPPTNTGKWDTLKANYPNLVNFATIGCEMCHGAGSQHAATFNPTKIAKSYDSGVCAQCHDEPWRHNKYSEYENSLHSEALWSSSFAQGSTSQNNSLANCIRCHDGKGYVNFTKGLTTNTTGMKSYNQTMIGCSTCHDPHGNTNTASLRFTPAASDTLATGLNIAGIGGAGHTCMNCHKARGNGDLQVAIGVTSSRFGPHHSVQTDVLLGKNAVVFGSTPFLSSEAHKTAITDACAGCHMYATVDTGNVNRDKVGGHSFRVTNPETGFDNTRACQSCHGLKNSFDDFVAVSDYDGDGTIESYQNEVIGLSTILKALLPVTVDSTNYNTVVKRKAYWNYQMIANDGSNGVHNPKFAIDVLTKSIMAMGGVVPVQLTSLTATVSGDVVTINFETATETNNKGFDIQRKVGNSWNTVGFIAGRGNSTEVNRYTFTDKASNLSGKVAYRLRQVDFDGSVEFSKEVEVTFEGPKSFTLSQNYPNPFNPSTTIKYSVPTDSKIKVVIYNLTGEVVKELVNTVQGAGSYEIKFDTKSAAKQLTSGIYFYSLEASALDGSNSFRETKKMVLLK
ncbi:MAG: ammonia-forming cytochrome c nitrite reductase subunit c552 [Syntrophothermus sp.]